MQFYFKIEPTMKRSSLTISLKLKLYTEKMKRKCYFPEEEGEKINYIFIPCALTWRGKRVMVEQWGHLEPGQKYPFPPENMVTRHQTENSFLPQPQTAHKLYKSWQIHNPVNKPLDHINFFIYIYIFISLNDGLHIFDNFFNKSYKTTKKSNKECCVKKQLEHMGCF